MKQKQNAYASQLLIVTLAAVIMLLMVQVAKAQTQELLAQNNQNSQHNNQNLPRGNMISSKMPSSSWARRMLDDTSLTYYQQFLGPTMAGNGNETYNVFQEGTDIERSGRAPLQSFHAVNLRHAINSSWSIGASLAAVNGYTDAVENRGGVRNGPEAEFFNARAYVMLPSFQTRFGTLFSTVSYEAPTSSISKEDEMRFGWVISESFAFNLPSMKWTAGILGQVYRIYYKNNSKPYYFQDGSQGIPTQLQTMIISGGPYVNYRFNDKWMLGSLITLDWDQRGVQSGSREFNNNLPHRGRVTATYFPQVKYLTSVGLFSQALLKFRPDTTAMGAEFALRF